MRKVFILKITLLILICFLQSTIIKCDECEDVLLSDLKTFNPIDISNPINSLGMGIANLGDYDICILTNTNKYTLLEIKTEDNYPIYNNFSFYNGLCLPEICTLPENLEKIKSKISEIFHIKKEKIDTIDVDNENEKFATFDVSKIFILSLLCVYLLFASGILKCIINFISSRNEKESSLNEGKNLKKVLYSINGNALHQKSLVVRRKNSDEIMTEDDNRKYSSFERNSKAVGITENSEMIVNTVNMHQYESSDFSSFEQNLPDNSIINNCFDIGKNIETIFAYREENLESGPELKIFDGVRVFTLVIIIFTTFAQFIRKMPLRNPEIAYDDYRTFIMQLFFNTTYSFDVLFAISGFIFAYTCINSRQKNGGFSFGKIIKMILLKLLRIWPLYVIAFLFYWKFFIYTLTGPLSGLKFNQELESCDKQWPFMLTMVSNFTFGLWEASPPYCMSWVWLFQFDLQYYIIGVILMAVYTKSNKIFWVLFSMTFLTFSAVEGWLLWDYDVKVNAFDLDNNQDYYKYFYYKSYTRSSPYWIGMLFGVIYAAYKTSLESSYYSKLRNTFHTIQRSSFLSWFFYLFGLAIMLSCIFCPYWSYENEWSFAWNFVYNFVGKKLFILGLFSFLLPLLLGNLYLFGGWLGCNAFFSLSKLSAIAYILHPLLMEYFFYNLRYSIYFSGSYYFVMGLSFLGASFILAVPIRLLFVMPFVSMRNFINGKAVTSGNNFNDPEDGKQGLLNSNSTR